MRPSPHCYMWQPTKKHTTNTKTGDWLYVVYTNCHDRLCSERPCSLYLLLAPLPIPSAGRKRQECHTHAIIFSQHTDHPSYLHDRNYWFSYYITSGQWFMPSWWHRTDGWYTLYPWPSWIAANPAGLGVGKHTPTWACSVQSKPTTSIHRSL